MKKDQYIHGGDIYREAEKLGINLESFLDYSSNINPLGIPKEIIDIIGNNIDKINRYPDTYCLDLRKEISKYLNLSSDSIIVANGALEVIFLYLNVLTPKKILMPVPTFCEYERIADFIKSDIDFIELNELNDFMLDIPLLFEKISERTELLILCNPNNPTSNLLRKSEMLKIIEYSKDKNIKVMVDETFIELTLEENKNSVAQYIKKYDNLFVVRAFTKMFSIPGLRIGYGIGSNSIVQEMWKIKMPWSVNSLATNIGSVLNSKEYFERTNKWLKEEIEWFYNELKKMPGLKPYRPSTNFILIKILDEKFSSELLKNEMVKEGILIRDASNFRGLNKRYIRIAVKDRISNISFMKVLKNVMG